MAPSWLRSAFRPREPTRTCARSRRAACSTTACTGRSWSGTLTTDTSRATELCPVGLLERPAVSRPFRFSAKLLKAQNVAGVMEILQFARTKWGGELIGIIILALGICLSLALVTYHPDDSSAFYTSTNTA